MAWGFAESNLREIVAYADESNANSRRVMTKLGMTHDPADDFDYPLSPKEHPDRRLVLYRAPAAAKAR